jgi:hypothetical protein
MAGFSAAVWGEGIDQLLDSALVYAEVEQHLSPDSECLRCANVAGDGQGFVVEPLAGRQVSSQNGPPGPGAEQLPPTVWQPRVLDERPHLLDPPVDLRQVPRLCAGMDPVIAGTIAKDRITETVGRVTGPGRLGQTLADRPGCALNW